MADAYHVAGRLRAAGQKASTIARAAVDKTALDIVVDAKNAAPVLTGNLKNSIHATTGLGGSDAPEATVQASTNYAYYVEHGTSRMGAQPYMGPAAEKNQPVFQAAMLKLGELFG